MARHCYWCIIAGFIFCFMNMWCKASFNNSVSDLIYTLLTTLFLIYFYRIFFSCACFLSRFSFSFSCTHDSPSFQHRTLFSWFRLLIFHPFDLYMENLHEHQLMKYTFFFLLNLNGQKENIWCRQSIFYKPKQKLIA